MTSIIKVNTIQDAGGNALLTSNGSGSITTNNIGGQNTPAWYVKLSGDQNVSGSSHTKITWDSEVFDTASAFASNKFTVPTGEGGKYFFHHRCAVDDLDDGEFAQLNLYKNGSEQLNYLITTRSAHASFTLAVQASGIIDLSAGDYLESYIYQSSSGTQHVESANSYFMGYKIIE
jgi:hypothetical protein